MQLNGSPPAEFRSDEDRTYFTVVLPAHLEAEKQATQATTQVTTQVKALEEKERALLEFCQLPQDRAEADRFFNYPFAALEEALVNAVYHRSYEEREPIEVRILPDHITITSYPGADRSISLEELAAGSVVSRRYRNRRIGDFLKELELTEGRGTGIPKIQRAMRSNGSPPAEFKTDADRTFFTIVLPMHLGAKNQTTPHVPPHVTPHVISELSEVEKELLRFCLTPQDRAKIQSHLKIRGSGRNFDFCYPSNFKTQRLTRIKGVVAADIPLVGA
jgi:predicted HTH transcriptional regulator